MGRSVVAHQSAAIQNESNGEILERDVMDQLIERALQKRRVDRDHRFDPLGCQPPGKRNRVLLGDPHVEQPVGVRLFEDVETGIVGHGGGNCHHIGVLLPQRGDRLAVDARVRRGGALGWYVAGYLVESRHAVRAQRILLRKVVPLPFLGEGVEQDRPAEVLDMVECLHQKLHVVAVDRAKIPESEFLEDDVGNNQCFDADLDFARQLTRFTTQFGNQAEQLPHVGFDAVVQLTGRYLGQVHVECADVLRNRHLVVVENDDQILVQNSRVVDRFERDTAGERTVAHQRDHLVVIAAEIPGRRHSQRGTDRRAGMADAERVVFALASFGKSAQAILLPERVKLVEPAGDHLVAVRLVADVPNDLVFGSVENVVERQCQFDRAQACTEVPARFADVFEDFFAQFARYLRKLSDLELLQVVRRFDFVE